MKCANTCDNDPGMNVRKNQVIHRKERRRVQNNTTRKRVQLNDACLLHLRLGYVAAFNAEATDRLHSI